MSSTVSVGDFTVTSNADAASMVESLRPEGEDDGQPKIITDRGEPAEKEPKEGLSKAASELGKEGAKAAAKARKEAIKAKPIKDAPAEPEKKAAPAPSEEAAEAGDEFQPEPTRKGNPRHDPEARVAQATREAREAREEAARERLERERLSHEVSLYRSGKAHPGAVAQEENVRGSERPATAQETGEPRLDDFLAENENYNAGLQAWMTARDKWRDGEAAKRFQAHTAAAKYASEVGGAVEKWRGRMGDEVKADPEFVATVKPITDQIGFPSRLLPQGERPGPKNWIADDLWSEPDRAPAILRHLAENEDVFQRLAALSSPRAITRELARIEASLDAATTGASSEPPKPQTSKASPPVRPVTGAPSVAQGDGAPRPGESFDDWNRRTSKR